MLQCTICHNNPNTQWLLQNRLLPQMTNQLVAGLKEDSETHPFQWSGSITYQGLRFLQISTVFSRERMEECVERHSGDLIPGVKKSVNFAPTTWPQGAWEMFSSSCSVREYDYCSPLHTHGLLRTLLKQAPGHILAD